MSRLTNEQSTRPQPHNSSARVRGPRTMSRWLPHPALSVFMWALWLLLVNEFSAGHIVLGAILAWLIPFLTHAFWPETTTLRKPLLAIRFVLLVLWDIVIANAVLALRVLGPTKKLQPAFMTLPLDVKEDFTITLLASTISLTPGTVSADLSADRSALLIHILHVDDIDTSITELKRRYETPLKEIFECS